jgi:hypothetical protein
LFQKISTTFFLIAFHHSLAASNNTQSFFSLQLCLVLLPKLISLKLLFFSLYLPKFFSEVNIQNGFVKMKSFISNGSSVGGNLKALEPLKSLLVDNDGSRKRVCSLHRLVSFSKQDAVTFQPR